MNKSIKRRQTVIILLVLAIISVLTYVSSGRITGKEIYVSTMSRQNGLISYHLWVDGTFSENAKSTYRREPLPIALTALHLALLTDIPKTVTFKEMTNNPALYRATCQVNLYYLVSLFFSVWWLSWLLTRSHWVAALAIIGTWVFFSHNWTYINSLRTEICGALFIVLGTAAVVWLVQTRRPISAILTGLAFGALALTKAASFYVALVAMPMLAIVLILQNVRQWRQSIWLVLLASMVYAAIVIPWMVRNYVDFGSFAISQGGAVVLMTRAVKNSMTEEEYVATFYVYSPASMKEYLFEPFLGFRSADLQPGGRWERLSRNKPGDTEAIKEGNVAMATSLYGKAGALIYRLRNEMAA